MLSTFTELNRKRPKAAFDFITHTTCSIVHAADDRSVMETLEALPAIIGSTRAMIGEKPYRIGPSAIAARMNPYGKGLLDNPATDGFASPTTIRASAVCSMRPGRSAMSPLAPTAGCRRSRWAPHAVRLGSFTTVRPTIGSPISIRSMVVLLSCVPCDGRSRSWRPAVILSRHSRPSRAGSPRLAWREGARSVLWLANLTAEPLTIRMGSFEDARLQATVLDSSAFEKVVGSLNALEVLRRPLKEAELNLDAYAVARVEVDNKQAP